MKKEIPKTHQWQYLYIHKYEPIALIHGKTIHGGEFIADELQTNWKGMSWVVKNLLEEIKKLNQEIAIPWIYELAPGSGWLPVGLEKNGHRFDYFGKTLSQKQQAHLEQIIGHWHINPEPDQPKFFVCYELLEHLWRPED